MVNEIDYTKIRDDLADLDSEGDIQNKEDQFVRNNDIARPNFYEQTDHSTDKKLL